MGSSLFRGKKNKTMGSSSTSVPSLMKDEEPRNWAELPSDLTSSIMLRLGVIEILENAQKVCTSWRRVSKTPSMWRKIDMHNLGDMRSSMKYDFEIMCRHAVDRSQGGLVEIDIWYFGTDNLLNYIADRASNLRSLRVANCSQITSEGIAKAVVKLPLLEDLNVSYCALSGQFLRAVGQSCPNLKTLKYNRIVESFADEPNNNAIAIAESMPQLRHLQLFANALNSTGLKAILDRCTYLEHLDLRRCLNIDLSKDLRKRLERIRVVRYTYDSIGDFPYHITMSLDCEDSNLIYDFHDVLYEFPCHSASGNA
ncbi:PREDICTED: F-box protein SKIP19-like [Camelina sativa]|uniref:F-box protein SKIP19-like n=1 Tax=Camelina sativa TaxID=90675 RepID=A0ABM0TT01_CAMSA|nr:PREDICTED: F-box protein SKIP19-like [Camelina sativa]